MALNKSIIAETLVTGSDLKLTDKSLYDITTPKSLFLNRHISITFSNGTVITKEFPYTNTDNSIQDTITYTSIFSKDSIVDIKVDFIYINSATTTESISFNYISDIFTLKCRSNLANKVCDCNDCYDEHDSLNLIDSNLTSAGYAAIFGEDEKAQKFLDKCYDICNSLKNSNCKDC